MAATWGLELEKGQIGLCQVRQTSQGLKVQRGVSLPLPPGLLTPSLTELNVAEEEELTAELRSLLNKAGWRGGRVALALPDLTCRVGYQDFEELNGTPSDIRQLLCWRLKDRLPFPAQGARMDYQPLPSGGKGARLLYLLAREAVIGQYETLLANVGLEPTRIISRGVALYRLFKVAGIGGKRLLLALGPSSLLFIYTEEGVTRLWRVLPWDDHGAQQDWRCRAEEMLRELQETLTYLGEEMGAGEPDSLLLMGEDEPLLAESLTKACRLSVETFPSPRDGLRAQFLASAGAALLQQAWRS
ncbi:MAG: hypothetical protein ACE5JQ_03445 [Candidatus Methylomirabilales bacterium]